MRKNTRVTPEGSTTTAGVPAARGAVPRTVTSLTDQPVEPRAEVNTATWPAVVRAATTSPPLGVWATETGPVTEAADSRVVRSVATQGLTALVEGATSRRWPRTGVRGEAKVGSVSGPGASGSLAGSSARRAAATGRRGPGHPRGPRPRRGRRRPRRDGAPGSTTAFCVRPEPHRVAALAQVWTCGARRPPWTRSPPVGMALHLRQDGIRGGTKWTGPGRSLSSREPDQEAR